VGSVDMSLMRKMELRGVAAVPAVAIRFIVRGAITKIRWNRNFSRKSDLFLIKKEMKNETVL
jgi:hypothetical protein